jgi:hypothetical protein
LDAVEQHLAVPKTQAAKALRPLLETNQIHNVLVGWQKRGRQSDPSARDWVAAGSPGDPHRYYVFALGWAHVDWQTGTLAGCEVQVRWGDVVSQLGSLAPQSGQQGQARAPNDDERACFWMRAYVMGWHDAGRKPKREETLKLCMAEAHVTYRQAESAWEGGVPVEWKNPPRKGDN